MVHRTPQRRVFLDLRPRTIWTDRPLSSISPSIPSISPWHLDVPSSLCFKVSATLLLGGISVTWQKGPNLSRYYDDHIPADILAKVIECRRSPSGLEHKVKTDLRGSEEVLRYPFNQMELGDFFIARLGGRTEASFRTIVRQAAARLDCELIITPWRIPSGGKAFRVCLTIIRVSRYKLAWERATGKEVKVSDGKWKARRRQRDASNKSVPGPAIQAKKLSKLNNPFWADNEPPPPEPETDAAPKEERLSRAEMLRRALGSSDVSE